MKITIKTYKNKDQVVLSLIGENGRRLGIRLVKPLSFGNEDNTYKVKTEFVQDIIDFITKEKTTIY